MSLKRRNWKLFIFDLPISLRPLKYTFDSYVCLFRELSSERVFERKNVHLIDNYRICIIRS